MKLSDSQLLVLSNAAQRGGRCIQLPSATARGATEKFVAKLAGAGLIEEIETTGGAPVWREVDGQRYSMRVTGRGLEAIGIVPEAETNPSHQKGKESASPTPRRTKPNSPKRKEGRHRVVKTAGPTRRPKKARVQKPKRSTGAQRPGTKIGEVLNLLSRRGGTTIDEIVRVTGWQAHSVRGALRLHSLRASY